MIYAMRIEVILSAHNRLVQCSSYLMATVTYIKSLTPCVEQGWQRNWAKDYEVKLLRWVMKGIHSEQLQKR